MNSRKCQTSTATPAKPGVFLFFHNIVKQLIRSLRDTGIRISLHNFGIGTASLTMLQQGMIDFVKVDRHLTQDLDVNLERKTLVKGLLDLCSNLGLIVIAEGVERAVQLQLLRVLGFGYAQGFHFSRPVPIEELYKQNPSPVEEGKTA